MEISEKKLMDENARLHEIADEVDNSNVKIMELESKLEHFKMHGERYERLYNDSDALNKELERELSGTKQQLIQLQHSFDTLRDDYSQMKQKKSNEVRSNIFLFFCFSISLY